MERDNIIHFDPIYLKYRKMWNEDRWRFSGELVRLTIKQSKGSISEQEERVLTTMNKVVDENGNRWLEGYTYNEGVLSKREVKLKKRR